ncbi:MAG: YciI family protein [Gemmatimonas sp.]
MRYLIMMNLPAATFDYTHQEWAPADWKAHTTAQSRLNKTLEGAGELVGIERLTSPKSAKLIHADANGLPNTDGVFAESKEFLAGFWVIDVASPERAYEIAAIVSALPGPGGKPLNMPVEVRAVMSGGSNNE